MAHELYIKNGLSAKDATPEDYALYLYKNPGWHGLGTVSDKVLPYSQVMEIAAMDFVAEKQELFAGPSLIPVPEKYANIDTKTGNVLGVVGEDYVNVQWDFVFSLIESMREFLPHGLVYESAGRLGNNGARGFIQIQLGDAFTFGNDSIVPYLNVYKSMDGSLSLTFAPTTVRVVCANTLEMAIRDAKSKFRSAMHSVRHAGDPETRAILAKNEIIRSSAIWAGMQEDLKKLSDTKAPENFVERFIVDVFGETPKDASPNMLTRIEKRNDKIWELYNGKTGVQISGDAIMSGYSAVNEYLQYHSLVHGEGTEQAFRRLESDMLGGIRGAKLNAYEKALAYV